MAAPLTWQDVAGQVNVTNYADTSALITQGIAGIGDAVAKLGGAKDERRKLEAAQQLQRLQMESEMARTLQKDLNATLDASEVRTEKKDAKEFGAAQAGLEALFREGALNGVSYKDLLQSEEYLRLGEGARAFGASDFSDAYERGSETRIRRADDAADDRRAQSNWEASHQLQKQNADEDRAYRAEGRKLREAAEAERLRNLPKVWKTGNDKTDRAMTELMLRTGTEWNEASGGAYEQVDLPSLSKGYTNPGAVGDIFNAINVRRMDEGKTALPQGVLKRVVSTGVGSNSFIDGTNDVDDPALEKAFEAAERQYDEAEAGRKLYTNLSAQVEGGRTLTTEDVDAEWNKLRPGKQGATPTQNNQSPVPNPASQGGDGASPSAAAVNVPPHIALLLEQAKARKLANAERAAAEQRRGEEARRMVATIMGNLPKAAAPGPAPVMTPAELIALRNRNLSR